MPFFALIVSLLLSIEVVGPESEVRPLAAAPTLVSPSGKATIQHLARGQMAYVGRLEMAGGAAVPEHADATGSGDRCGAAATARGVSRDIGIRIERHG